MFGISHPCLEIPTLKVDSIRIVPNDKETNLDISNKPDEEQETQTIFASNGIISDDDQPNHENEKHQESKKIVDQ